MGANVYVALISVQPMIGGAATVIGQEIYTETVLYKWTKFCRETLYILRTDSDHFLALKNDLGPEDDWIRYYYCFISPPIDDWEKARKLEKLAEKGVDLFHYVASETSGRRYNRGVPPVHYTPTPPTPVPVTLPRQSSERAGMETNSRTPFPEIPLGLLNSGQQPPASGRDERRTSTPIPSPNQVPIPQNGVQVTQVLADVHVPPPTTSTFTELQTRQHHLAQGQNDQYQMEQNLREESVRHHMEQQLQGNGGNVSFSPPPVGDQNHGTAAAWAPLSRATNINEMGFHGGNPSAVRTSGGHGQNIIQQLHPHRYASGQVATEAFDQNSTRQQHHTYAHDRIDSEADLARTAHQHLGHDHNSPFTQRELHFGEGEFGTRNAGNTMQCTSASGASIHSLSSSSLSPVTALPTTPFPQGNTDSAAHRRVTKEQASSQLTTQLATLNSNIEDQNKEIKNLKQLVTQMQQQPATAAVPLIPEIANLPTKTIKEFKKLVKKLKNDEPARIEFNRVIIRVGGDDEKNAVERAWEKIGIPSVLAQVNWEGRKRKDREQKTGVARTKFLEVLLDSLRQIPVCLTLTDSQFKAHCQRILKGKPRSAKCRKNLPAIESSDSDEENE